MRDKDVRDIVLEVLKEILEVTEYEIKENPSYEGQTDYDKPKKLSFEYKLNKFIDDNL